MEPRRPLTRTERAVVYALLGLGVEVGFTALREALSERRTWRLEGHSYLWMLPIYALIAVLYEPLHGAVRRAPLWHRAMMYGAGFLGVEYLSGTALRRAVGLVPWDYTGASRWTLPGGAVRADYAPLWAAAGLMLEPVHDTLLEVRVPRRAHRR